MKVSDKSKSRQDYLKAIFSFELKGMKVSTTSISEKLMTKPASVTGMFKVLSDLGLIEYKPYQGAELTDLGRSEAISLMRKHRLWETFMVKNLGFGWDEVHEVAEQLEHVESNELVDRLDTYMGYPAFDPHGDPIPDSKGRLASQQQELLSVVSLHKSVEITAVGSQSSELLELLKHKGLQMGTRLEVKKIFDFDGSLELKIKNQQIVTISRDLASVLFVKPV